MSSAEQVQIRRDTASNLIATTPAQGELGYNTTDKRLVVGDGVTPGGTPHPNFSDIQKQTFGYPSVGGSANALTFTFGLQPLAWVDGLSFTAKAAADNTGAMTAAITGLVGTKDVVKMKGGMLSPMEDGDVVSGGIYEFRYDGTQLQIKGLDEGGGGTQGWELLAIATGGGGSYDFTSGIDTTYRNYVFVLENLVPATDNVSLFLRTRRSGQSAFDAAAGNYAWVLQKVAALNGGGGGSAGMVGPGADTVIALVQLARNTVNGGAGISGNVFAHGLGQAARAKFVANTAVEQNSSGYMTLSPAAGMRLSASALDGVRFFFSSGNIASGSIYLYGIRSSLT